ncbi:TPA: SA1788 family PVL leukocidin-associated protein [Staphylococcus aureus]
MGSVVIINNKPYKFNNFEKELMAKRGINAGIVSKRARGRWEFSEALDAPYGMHLKEYREMKQMEKVKQARLERKLDRERKKELEKKASAWDRYCKSVEKDLINEFGNDDERVKFGMELNNKIFTEDDTNG